MPEKIVGGVAKVSKDPAHGAGSMECAAPESLVGLIIQMDVNRATSET